MSDSMKSFLIGLALAPALGGALVAQGPSPRVQFVAVAPDVKLEVLDWGGPGRPVVLLAGNTKTAHSFAEFAPMLASSYHVYGITRRGFGASSAPATGYEADRLADDVLAVLDSLRLTVPVLAGHSLAGQELSSIGSRHPERVAGLVYLDAGYQYAYYDSTRGDYEIDANEMRRHQEQLRAAASKGAFAEVNRLLARLVEVDVPAMERDLHKMQTETQALAAGPPRPIMPPPASGIARAILEGMQPYTSIRAPVLAIYAVHATDAIATGGDSAATQRWLVSHEPAAAAFARGVPTARVLMVTNATHFVFDSNPAIVLQAMRAFIATLPPVR